MGALQCRSWLLRRWHVYCSSKRPWVFPALATQLPLSDLSHSQQFAVLIGQIQAPEDVRAPTPRPTTPPISTPAPASNINTPSRSTDAQEQAQESDDQTAPLLPTTAPPAAPTPVAPTPTAVNVTSPPARPSSARILWDHFRTDPSARICETIYFPVLTRFFLIYIVLHLQGPSCAFSS